MTHRLTPQSPARDNNTVLAAASLLKREQTMHAASTRCAQFARELLHSGRDRFPIVARSSDMCHERTSVRHLLLDALKNSSGKQARRVQCWIIRGNAFHDENEEKHAPVSSFTVYQMSITRAALDSRNSRCSSFEQAPRLIFRSQHRMTN